MNESNQNTLKYYLSPKFSSKKTLVLDLDETLVHSQFVPFSIKSDIIFKINLDNQLHDIHVLIRPGVQEFFEKMGKLYEIIVFTASESKYADPLLDMIDKGHNCSYRLFREHCSMVGITYIKDLKKLGRDLKDIIIVDNSPLSYSFNPENGIPILTWFNDKNDKELYNLIPILEFLSQVYDVREYIKQIVVNDCISYDNAINVIENYTKVKHDDINKKYIEQIKNNKKNCYLKDSKGKENDKNKNNIFYNENNNINLITNKTTGKKGKKKNFVNITISNNSINNFLYFSPIYKINNTNNINNTNSNNNNYYNNDYDNDSIYDNDIEIKINPKIFQSKDNSLRIKAHKTKSKEFLNKINNKKKNKMKNKSNDIKKLNYLSNNNNNNISKYYKERINTAGNNKSINYCINLNNHLNNTETKNYKENNSLNPKIVDLKTIIPPKKINLLKDYQLPKTPEIEEILFPFNEKIINNINNKRTISNINKNIFPSRSRSRRGSSGDNKKKNNYHFRNNLYKFNNQMRPNSVINHEKHKSFNYTPFTFEHSMVNSLKKNNNLNNYIFYEPLQSSTCKNSSYSNNKIIRAIKKNKTNKIKKNNISLNSIHKNCISFNDNINQGKNISIKNKSKISIDNNNHKKALSNNHLKIIGISEYNKPNKIKKLIKYNNLIIQNTDNISNNYQKIYPTNRTINTENSYNCYLKCYRKGLNTSKLKTIHNDIKRTNQIINHKKLFNNPALKKNMKKCLTNTKELSNYDNFISHKKTLSYNTEINSYKLIKRTNSSSLTKQKNLKRSNNKDIYINHTNNTYNSNINNDKCNNIIKITKREVNDIINKRPSNKITKIKEIKYININGNNINKNNIKKNICDNNNMICNLIEYNNNNHYNKIKKNTKNNRFKKINID